MINTVSKNAIDMEVNMLTRFIQETVRGYFFIALPKPLVEAVGFKKGVEMGIEYKNNSIIMTPVVDSLPGSTATEA